MKGQKTESHNVFSSFHADLGEDELGTRDLDCARWRLEGGHWALAFATVSIVRAGTVIIRNYLSTLLKAGSTVGPEARFWLAWGSWLPGSQKRDIGRPVWEFLGAKDGIWGARVARSS